MGSICECAVMNYEDFSVLNSGGTCDAPCRGDQALTCGGSAAFDLYELVPAGSRSPSPPLPVSAGAGAAAQGEGRSSGDDLPMHHEELDRVIRRKMTVMEDGGVDNSSAKSDGDVNDDDDGMHDDAGNNGECLENDEDVLPGEASDLFVGLAFFVGGLLLSVKAWRGNQPAAPVRAGCVPSGSNNKRGTKEKTPGTVVALYFVLFCVLMLVFAGLHFDNSYDDDHHYRRHHHGDGDGAGTSAGHNDNGDDERYWESDETLSVVVFASSLAFASCIMGAMVVMLLCCWRDKKPPLPPPPPLTGSARRANNRRLRGGR